MAVTVRGGKKDKYVLARPKKGPVASVPEASCTADPGADALTVDNPEKGDITDSALGRWVEIGGRLEKETSKDPDNLRELDVATFKLVPVVVPPPPAAATAPAPAARHRHRPHGPPEPTPAPASANPRASISCRRRRASFQRLDWPGCSRLQQASRFVRSVSGNEVDAGAPDLLTPRPRGRAVTQTSAFVDDPPIDCTRAGSQSSLITLGARRSPPRADRPFIGVMEPVVSTP